MQEIIKEKHKATINFARENWIKLLNLAAMQNTSATAILNELVDAYVNEKLPLFVRDNNLFLKIGFSVPK